jgi:nicotinate-nucleotide pyrophosphorylase (carboxylating)
VRTETDVEHVVRSALAEDVGTGDVTTEGLFDEDATCRAELLLKEPGVVCGLEVAALVFATCDAEVTLAAAYADGDAVGDVPARLGTVDGPTRAILTAERTALNFLGRLSGIATLTRRYVEAIEGTGAVILDTRKTTPGLRALEKHAVYCGGAANHRFGLHDAILVKDNHLRLAGGIAAALERLQDAGSGLPIEVEVEDLAGLEIALEAGADRVLLDNMSLEELRAAVRLTAGRVPLEASGGVTLATVRAIAETGVDVISIGALTHSARALDVSLEVLP